MNNKSEEKNKTPVLFLIVTTISLLVLMAGATFAYFTITVRGNDASSSLIVKSASLGITYDTGDAIVAYLQPNGESHKTFRVINNGNASINYNVKWIVTSNTLANKTDLKYDVIGSVESGTGTTMSATAQVAPSTDINMLSNITIAPNTTHKYEFRIYFELTTENQNANQNKEFIAKIEINPA